MVPCVRLVTRREAGVSRQFPTSAVVSHWLHSISNIERLVYECRSEKKLLFPEVCIQGLISYVHVQLTTILTSYRNILICSLMSVGWSW